MEEAIKNFAKQFAWKPEIQNAEAFRPAKRLVVAGMGGSHLAADLLSAYNPRLDVYVHRDYGLPPLSDERLSDSLLVASSYSGNTEETIDFAEEAHAKKFNVVAVAVGGKLIDFAKKNNLPYILIPDTGIQPRSALGFSITALAKFFGNTTMLAALSKLSKVLNPETLRAEGEKLAAIV